MKNPFGIITRKCKKTDYNFVYNLNKKELLIPYISKYVKINKKIFNKDFGKNFNRITILMKGKKRIGFYQLSKEKNYLEIQNIILSSAYKGRGIGSFLLKYFETLGRNKIRLQVWENNPAFKLYKKLGYRVVTKKNHKYHMQKEELK